MDTRQDILRLADELIREKGFNAFSFSDIGRSLNLRNASIHYHFPSKTDLGLAIVTMHRAQVADLARRTASKTPTEKLQAFLSIYSTARRLDRICLVGSLATDLYTVDPSIRKELKALADDILHWLTQILEEGKRRRLFHFSCAARTKALLIVTTMLAAVQLTRLTGKKDFQTIQHTLINELTQDKP